LNTGLLLSELWWHGFTSPKLGNYRNVMAVQIP